MSIYGFDASSGSGQDLSDYVKKAYVDVQDGLRVLKAGDTMNGDLAMGGNLVRGLPTVHPPFYSGDEATSWIQAVSLVQDAGGNLADPPQAAYVDGRKPLITVWAEEKGPIDDGGYEWSFGNGASGAAHANCGYTMMAAGRVLRMGLAASASTSTPLVATVNIVVNGTDHKLYRVTKSSGHYSGTTTFGTPLELAQGDRVNFRSVLNTTDITSAVVSLLIELDL